ncbi:unnamed protein product [Dovyalis caffra]|uniref:Uncharacterized protein n=1 Tax=Dovyalis caffra TaxID=77055 RepID=A0AAV1RNC1_9ROSI|nr:unnamed protein product [Dovyalis caffra]
MPSRILHITRGTRVKDYKFVGKLDPTDNQKNEKAVHETAEWLDGNQLAEIDELEDMVVLGGGDTYMGGGMPEGGSTGSNRGPGPKIEEVESKLKHGVFEDQGSVVLFCFFVVIS